jgi:hypothetical protein
MKWQAIFQMTDFPCLTSIEAFIYTSPPRVGTVPNWSVQRGPIALPNLLCARSFTQNLCPRNRPANA